MSKLNNFKPLAWRELQKYGKEYQDKATKQFINLLGRFGNTKADFKYGDEIEYTFVKFNDLEKSVEVLPISNEVLEDFASKRLPNLKYDDCHFTPEMAKFQIEGKPAHPFLENQLLRVEENMIQRRKILKSSLKGHEDVFTVATFPRSTSLFHPRDVFTTDPLAKFLEDNFKNRNIDEQGCQDATGKVPIYEDTTTGTSISDVVSHSGPAFGAFQVTMQAKDLEEAKILHDSLAVLCPIMLSITASCPILNGHLVETDTRWEALHAWYDDRHRNKEHRHTRPRLCSIPAYLSPGSQPYNNVDELFNKDAEKELLENGVDELLARHIAILCSREPLYLLENELTSSDDETAVLENVLSSHWPSVKLKPPLAKGEGWRVEFRVCDVQLTDFKNAALIVFLVLFSRISLCYNIDFRIPITHLDYNMTKASKRNASKEGFAYWFQVNRKIFETNPNAATDGDKVKNFEKITVNTIINGKGGVFYGLIPIMKKYLQEETNYTDPELEQFYKYLNYISSIAEGRRVTAARWMRSFVFSHADYKKDSLVTDNIAYDLLKAIELKEKSSFYT